MSAAARAGSPTSIDVDLRRAHRGDPAVAGLLRRRSPRCARRCAARRRPSAERRSPASRSLAARSLPPRASSGRRPALGAVGADRAGRADRAVHPAGAVGDLASSSGSSRDVRLEGRPGQRRQRARRPGRRRRRSASLAAMVASRFRLLGEVSVPVAAVAQRAADHRARPDPQQHVRVDQQHPAPAGRRDRRVLPRLRQHPARAARGRPHPPGADGQLRGRRLDVHPAGAAARRAAVRLHRPAAGVVAGGHRRGGRRSTSAACRTASAPGSPRRRRTPPTPAPGPSWSARACSVSSSTSPRSCWSGSPCPGGAAWHHARPSSIPGGSDENDLGRRRSRPSVAARCAACGTADEDRPGAAGASGGVTDRSSCSCSGSCQAQFAGYIAAVDKGFYREQGLDVEILEGGVDIVPQTVLAQGQADYAVAWVPKALASREQGAEITDVGQIFQRSGTYQVASPDSGIKAPADLKGKKVGNWGFGNEFELFAGMTKAGLDPGKDVTLVQQQFDMQALLQRDIDAAQAMSYNEYAQLLEAKNPATGAAVPAVGLHGHRLERRRHRRCCRTRCGPTPRSCKRHRRTRTRRSSSSTGTHQGLGVLPGQRRGVPRPGGQQGLQARREPPAVADERGQQADLAVAQRASA